MKNNHWNRFWKSYVDEQAHPDLNQTMPRRPLKIVLGVAAVLLVVFLLNYFLPREGAKRLRASSQQVDCIAFSPVGHRVATMSPDNEILFWDVEKAEREGSFYGSYYGSHIRSMMFSPDGTLLLLAPEKGHLIVFRISDAWPERMIPEEDTIEMEFRAATFSPDGTMIATAVANRIDIWKLVADPKPQLGDNFTYEELLANIEALRQPEAPALTINTEGETLNCIAYTPDGQNIVAAAMDGTVRLWNVATATATAVRDFKGHRDAVCDVDISNDGTTLVTASADSTIRLWNMTTAKEQLCIDKHHGLVLSVDLAPDGSWLASASNDGTVAVWDAATGKCKKQFKPGGDKWSRVAISPDGRYLVAGSIIERVNRGGKYVHYYTYESYVYLWKAKWAK